MHSEIFKTWTYKSSFDEVEEQINGYIQEGWSVKHFKIRHSEYVNIGNRIFVVFTREKRTDDRRCNLYNIQEI